MAAQARVEKLPNGRWRGVATMNGRRVTKVFFSEGAALVWAQTEMLRHARHLADPVEPTPQRELPPAPAFGRYASVWAETHPAYRSPVRMLVRDFGDWPIDAIQTHHLQLDIDKMSHAGGAYRKPATIRTRYAACKLIFDAAIAENLMDPPNPCAGLKMPTIAEAPFHVYTDDEEAELLAACASDEHRLVILLALYAGLRWGEVFALARHRLNPLQGWKITVAATVNRTGRAAIQPYTKNRNVRYLPPSPAVLREALAAHLDAHPKIPKDGLLFPNRLNQVTCYGTWSYEWTQIRARAGLEGMRFHDLRHTYGTRLAGAGLPIKEIATLMGHTNTDRTQVYLHVAGPQVLEQWIRFAFDGGPSPVFPRSPGQALD